MKCSQCDGIENLFGSELVRKELAQYRAKGPSKTTRLLIEEIKKSGVEGLTLLDIGGGVGAVQHALLEAGVERAVSVDASSAFVAAAKIEARRRGLSERVLHLHGDFTDLATDIAPADIVTLDRVICCYPDMNRLVGLSAARAGRIYGLVYPRVTWWVKIGFFFMNLILRLQRNDFEGFLHSSKAVANLLEENGLEQCSYHKTLVWQVVVYQRRQVSANE